MTVDLPPEFEKNMRARLGSGFESFHKAMSLPAPVSVRLNPHKPSAMAGTQVPWCAWGRYLDQRPVFTLDPQLHAGAYYVQEASSMFIGEALGQTADLSKKLVVLDLCAAPGGKSTHVASLLSEESLLVSNEVIRARASILSENLQKWGSCHTIVTQNDPADFDDLPDFFDIILLDAPCSGEGLFRKDPEAKSEWSIQHTEHCALRQKRILEDIWPSLKPGGILVYSTCTYNEAENIQGVQSIQEREGAESIPLRIDPQWNIETLVYRSCTGYQFFPHKLMGEGFFVSVLKKKSEKISPGFATQRWQPASRAVKEEVGNWVKNPESKTFFMHEQNVRMLPKGYETAFQMLLNHLNVIAAGTSLAEVMRNKLVPDHALALSTEINPDAFHRITVDESTALTYLRKDPLMLDGPIGFARIEFEGLGLGWVNVLSNRINNMYPSNWRVRMK